MDKLTYNNTWIMDNRIIYQLTLQNNNMYSRPNLKNIHINRKLQTSN